ncbi:COX15/CtaA family protein [Wenzhouxiangella limi]|uniref:Heme A synthase n=1 Tax=Wenzhouxiangella limi TaxID=2707351 RepID=A0A845VC49_9GAMM|nr:COX15/CtaA family protein [Wenzhouxiangella limi]NDY94859.1 heme A synthase [Wenzhouxiangella limi]
MSRSLYNKLALFACGLTLVVIVLGAWVRLTDAGLGCPDWPGCYGHLTWPASDSDLALAEQVRIDRAVDVGAAIREMVHRYAAALLGLVVVILAAAAWRKRREPGQPVKLPLLLLALILFQGALGAWTVTLLLKPAIVLAHLTGGMLTFSLLVLLYLRTRPRQVRPNLPQRKLRPAIVLATVVLVAQVLLGGWVSTNYAALACPDFPTCTGQWWPESNFSEGFRLWRGVGVDYEGGILDQQARVAIHLSHRIGAVIVVGIFGWLLWRLFHTPGLSRPAALLSALLATQVTLGILNIVWSLPLAVAVAHNGVAALLLGTMVYLLHRTTYREPSTA